MSEIREVNFDGLVGPTHTFSGLSSGNLASHQNAQKPSNPRAAALQGLAKMKLLHERGLIQGVFPPHPRPHFEALKAVGFKGTRDEILSQAGSIEPSMLWQVNSASAMWVANSATVSPSADTSDNRVHFTPANLVSHFHRSIETSFTARMLQTVFADEKHFAVHEPLPATSELGDEGAANHVRLAASRGGPGVELFVYGTDRTVTDVPRRFAARQTLAASRAVARSHGVESAVFAQQSPQAIDAGAFHNDVVSVGDSSMLLMHEQAFLNSGAVLAQLRDRLPGLTVVEVPAQLVSLEDAISSYLFNSQLVSVPDGGTALVAEQRCAEFPGVQATLDQLLAEQSITEVLWVDLSESMRNGGGPACLRLRVQLTSEQLSSVHPGFILDDAKIETLERWIVEHYREELTPAQLGDPSLAREAQSALKALGGILAAPSLYEELP